MIAAVEITSELIPYILIAIAAMFALGYFIGYKLGRIDGNNEHKERSTAEGGAPMTNEQKYTAQEMREVAEGLVDSCVADNISILVGHGNLKVVKGDRIVAMLSYAAGVVEENAQLKARLAAVVKTADDLCDEVEFSMSWIDPKANIQHINERIAACRAARGEVGAE